MTWSGQRESGGSQLPFAGSWRGSLTASQGEQTSAAVMKNEGSGKNLPFPHLNVVGGEKWSESGQDKRESLLKRLVESLFISGQQSQQHRQQRLRETMATRGSCPRKQSSKHIQSDTERPCTAILTREEEEKK